MDFVCPQLLDLDIQKQRHEKLRRRPDTGRPAKQFHVVESLDAASGYWPPAFETIFASSQEGLLHSARQLEQKFRTMVLMDLDSLASRSCLVAETLSVENQTAKHLT